MNRLTTKRLHTLVYINYNKKLKDRHRRLKSLKEGENPLILKEVPSDDEWIAVHDIGAPSNTCDVNDDDSSLNFSQSKGIESSTRTQSQPIRKRIFSRKVAKRTSVFYDPTMETQELTAVIKQDITALNSVVVDLQLLCNSRNGNSNISSDTTTHSTAVVDDLKNQLMSATKDFKELLTMRTEVHENRKQLFSSTASNNPFVRQRPLAAKPAGSTSAAPALPWASRGQSSSRPYPKNQMDGETRVTRPLMSQQQHQQQQELESTIHELGNIFNQLAILVSQRGEIAIGQKRER